MAMTVIFALVAAFVLSLTFVPAMVALCIRGRVTRKGQRAHPAGEAGLCAGAAAGAAPALRDGGPGGRRLCGRPAAVSEPGPGVCPHAGRAGPGDAGLADSQHGAHAITADAVPGRKDAQRLPGSGLCVFQNGHGRNGL